MVKNLIAIIFILTMASACRAKYSLEKSNSFEEMLSPGMSVDEVEQILSQLKNIEPLEEFEFPDGDFGKRYRTPINQWGASIFIFRFSPEGKLITVWGELPTD